MPLVTSQRALFFFTLNPSSRPVDASAGLEVSLSLDGIPSLVHGIVLCVVVRNRLPSPRLLVEHLNAQLKKYNGVAQDCFWKTQQEVHIKAGEGRDRFAPLKRAGRGFSIHIPSAELTTNCCRTLAPTPQF